MTRIPFVAAAAAGVVAALLPGCSDSGAEAGEAGKASGKTAAEAVRDDLPRPQPGLYKTTVTMTGIEVPGMPDGMEGHGAGLTRTLEDCLTPEEVDKGFEALVKQGQDGECSYESFNVAGGKLDAVMVCQAEGREVRMEMTGTTSPTGADLEARMALAFDGPGSATMSFTAKHERIGECPAGE